MPDPFIDTLLSRHGVRAQALRCVARLDCEVWRVRPQHGADLAVRLDPLRQQNLDAIGTELDWLQALAAAGLHVPVPQCSADGTQLHAAITAFGRGPGCWGLVHGDLHPWNLLFVRGAAGAIGFSDCGLGHRTMDLAATLQYLRYPLAMNHDHRHQYPALHDALLQGYAAEQALPAGVVQQVQVLTTARLFVTLAWMLDDWPTLDHRRWGPGFIQGSQQALRAWLAAPARGRSQARRLKSRDEIARCAPAVQLRTDRSARRGAAQPLVRSAQRGA